MRFARLFPGIALALLIPACAHRVDRPDPARAQTARPGSDSAPLPAGLAPSFPGPTSEASAPCFGQVLPILQARCNPCHFPGGSMHDRLPFDRPETIRALGTKLFTRIKDPAEQDLISRFLGAPAGGVPKAEELPAGPDHPAQPAN